MHHSIELLPSYPILCDSLSPSPQCHPMTFHLAIHHLLAPVLPPPCPMIHHTDWLSQIGGDGIQEFGQESHLCYHALTQEETEDYGHYRWYVYSDQCFQLS